jgi:hypothetical protein
VSDRAQDLLGTPQSHWDNILELARLNSKIELSITLGAELLEVPSVGN